MPPPPSSPVELCWPGPGGGGGGRPQRQPGPSSCLSAFLSRVNGGFFAHCQFFQVNNSSETRLFSQETKAFRVNSKTIKRKIQ